MEKIVAIILLAVSLAGCADTADVQSRCVQQCGGKGYQDERCQSLCSDDLSGSRASSNP